MRSVVSEDADFNDYIKEYIENDLNDMRDSLFEMKTLQNGYESWYAGGEYHIDGKKWFIRRNSPSSQEFHASTKPFS